MATITRSSVLLWFQNLLGLQAGNDKIPTELNDKIMPVVDITPKITTIVRAADNAVTGGIVAYTTPSDKDFFLTYLHFGYTKDVAATSGAIYVRFYTDGAIRYITLTAQSTTAETRFSDITFPYPIKIDKNTAIDMIGAFGAGAMTKYMTIGGYILE